MTAPEEPPSPNPNGPLIPAKSTDYDPPLKAVPTASVTFTPGTEAPSGWLEEEAKPPPNEKAAVSFGSETLPQRSKLLNRPPTPPIPTRKRGQAGVPPKGAKKESSQERKVTFGPVSGGSEKVDEAEKAGDDEKVDEAQKVEDTRPKPE